MACNQFGVIAARVSACHVNFTFTKVFILIRFGRAIILRIRTDFRCTDSRNLSAIDVTLCLGRLDHVGLS